jgi:hypothetical protein
MDIDLQKPAVVFWPVGNGDSVSIMVNDDHWMQVDLNHRSDAGPDSPYAAVIDELIKELPLRNGRPYLSVFALTHPDQDHCLGFRDLLKRTSIGELWFSPRVFREYKCDLCDDAVAFRDEAMRRVRAMKRDANAGSGNRIRLIGYDELLSDSDFSGFPLEKLTTPGNAITTLDGVQPPGVFRAFVHAPFKDDAAGERNETSLAFQIQLGRGTALGHIMLLGDHSYPVLRRIFEVSDATDLRWNVLLAPHHCSKSAMYWSDNSQEEALRQDILDRLGRNGAASRYIVASSEPIPSSNSPGDNPPHAKAKRRYLEILQDGNFLCTQEDGANKKALPICFEVTDYGLTYKASAEKLVHVNPTQAALAPFVGRDRAPVKLQRYG